MFVAPVNDKSRVCIVASLCLNADPAPRTMVGPSRGAYTRVALRDSGFSLPASPGHSTPRARQQHQNRRVLGRTRYRTSSPAPTRRTGEVLQTFSQRDAVVTQVVSLEF